MSLTQSQQEAISARGNVLVVAGAGTGKTRTLVERCLDCLLHEQPPASLEEILVVTFTEAAAAEMRQRIRARLAEELEKDPQTPRWQEQLALFDLANIGTLHGFCFRLVREHFYELQLDPQLAVIEPAEARILAEETLDILLQKHYSGAGPEAEAVQRLIQDQGRGWDKPIRALILRVHQYAQTLADPEGWLKAQMAGFTVETAGPWPALLAEALQVCRRNWGPVARSLAAGNPVASACAEILEGLRADASRPEIASALQAVRQAFADCPKGKKTLYVKPLQGLLSDAEFLAALAPVSDAGDPLQEDWTWVRGHMTTLLQLTGEFARDFTEAKRELGMLDFHDLEQYTLRLLWDAENGGPTRMALEQRRKLRFVFVDEYQDINAAQDKIIEALSREGVQANRFLVGDVKQSIYRFRLANPRIFQGYHREWAGGKGRVITLADNYRSREGVLDFINSLFSAIMGPGSGELTYDDQARLRFGAPSDRRPLSVAADPAPCVELNLRVNGNGDEEEEDGELLAEFRDLEEAEKEACLVASRLKQLRAEGTLVWESAAGEFRPVRWRDMAVLLRAPSGKAESYAKAFAQMNVPLQVERGGFYQSLEISDLLSVLQLLDNPLQDLPLLAVLRSPLVGLGLDDLASIRVTARRSHFWTALVKWSELPEGGKKSEGAAVKVRAFLERFVRWRRLARQVALSRCLESVLRETHFSDWLLSQPRGEQRKANVERLVALAQQFDRFQRQGLFRFLRFIEAQQTLQAEPEAAPNPDSDSVRLMSIHQSKGLEFPVVVAADLSKPFNTGDLRAEVILDEKYGLCPQVKPPQTGRRYPSLPYWLARERQRQELLSEEQRLLYVALTRARDRLLLNATVSQKKLDGLGQGLGVVPSPARCFADWILAWFAQQVPAGQRGPAGETSLIQWKTHGDDALAGERGEASTGIAPSGPSGSRDEWRQLSSRLSWTYAHTAATRVPAKSSVTALRRVAGEQASLDASPMFARSEPKAVAREPSRSAKGSRAPEGPAQLAPAEIGNAHHTFLEHLEFGQTGSATALKQEAERLLDSGVLRSDEVNLLDFEGVAAFWNSETGQAIRLRAGSVRRELRFTARFTPRELAEITREPLAAGLEGEFVVVQGVVDLAVIMPGEIWVLDFKTDHVNPVELADRARAYAPQLQLYARALAGIYARPVTKSWLYFLAGRTLVPV